MTIAVPVRRGPRASRIALIAASVPDETSRTISTDGTASTISAASSTSASVGAPNDVPSRGGLDHRRERLRIGVPEDQRPPRHHPVDVAAAVDVLDLRALAAAHEQRLVEADRAHRAHRRVDAAGDQLERAPIELGARPQSHAARSFVQYETTMSAPARLIAVSDSSAAVCSSSQPRAAAALTIAYSPETL